MRVKIGPYPGRRTKNQERKIDVKIDKFDTWNMDHTLALIILPMLKQLKETKHGSPNTDDEDVPVELQSISAKTKENEWDTDEFHHQRWDWILDEMIWAFEQIVDEDSEQQFYFGESDFRWQAFDKKGNKLGEPKETDDPTKIKGVSTYQMVKGPNDTFKYDIEAHQKHDERIKKALCLFGRYYRCLWD